MTSKRSAAIRRLLADLRRPETRGDALRRVRRRAVSTVRGLVAGAQPRGATVAHPTTPAQAREAADLARRHGAEAALAEAIARGADLERAVCRSVAELAESRDWGDWNAAWSLAAGVGRLPGGAPASALGHAILLHRRRQFARAWDRLRDLDDDTLARYLPVEAVDGALASASPEARQRALAIGGLTGGMDAPVLVDLAGRFLAFGERQRAADLIRELHRRSPGDLDDRRRHAWAVIERRLEPRAVAVPAGSVPVGILTYQTPDHALTSGNVGDYIQTLAMIGNLARLGGVAYAGDEGLGTLMADLQARVRPDLRLPDVTGSVHLVPVDRDFSSMSDVPEGTWMFAFGWHMHPLFDLRYDFPYHANIRPLFVSFHVNRLDMLTDEAMAYLRRHGPVGCRDWNTVFLLLSAGIDAFFTGCLTTTVDALFPARDAVYRGGGATGLIDVPPRRAGGARNVRTFSHQAEAYRGLPVTGGLRAASDTLAGYQRDLARAVTGRLHAYLPLTSLGVPVEFTPGSPGDVRFAGLVGLHPGDPALEAMRGGIRDLVAAALAKVVAGAPEDEVYGLWRDLTRDRVAEARARFAAPAADTLTTVDVDAAVASSLAGSRRFGPHEAVDPGAVTDIVLAFDQNLTLPAAVLVESMVANASGPLRLWILGRGLGHAYEAWLGAAFPSLPMTFLPCDGITYEAAGPRRRIPKRITVSTMDRLLLPVLLPDVRRVVYVDTDTLVLDDICRLAAIDLGGRPLAACDSNVSEASEWQRAGLRLDEPAATELRRRMGAEHGYGHAALNAGVLVMDLDRMRRDDFTRRYLGLGERFGLHDQDTMLAYVGPDRAVIDPRWNAMPVIRDVADPRLIHWASFPKPWDPPISHAQETWQAYASRLRDRAGTPPTAADAVTGPPGTLRNPVPVGPARGELAPELERVIAAVRAEHLSYLDAVSLRTLAATVGDLEAAGIEGLIIEAGTARGGSAITLATAKSPGRRMKVYDVFGMIPPPGERDGADVHRRYATIASGKSQGIGGETYYGYRDDLLAEVTGSFARHGVPIDAAGVELIQGRFEDTIDLDEPVALAHLDGDWYASTMACLTRIAPHLAVGGRLVIDDYDTWSGCRTAVDEYFAGREGYRFERRGRLHVIRE